VAPVVKPKTMETQELMDIVIDCYRRFYMGKLKQVPTMTPQKREYFMTTMNLLMKNSYLKQYMGGLGAMPKEIERLLAGLKK
jgi:anaerobic magnesium-protoporphyrin IX monomethyl ester cyclase